MILLIRFLFIITEHLIQLTKFDSGLAIAGKLSGLLIYIAEKYFLFFIVIFIALFL